MTHRKGNSNMAFYWRSSLSNVCARLCRVEWEETITSNRVIVGVKIECESITNEITIDRAKGLLFFPLVGSVDRENLFLPVHLPLTIRWKITKNFPRRTFCNCFIQLSSSNNNNNDDDDNDDGDDGPNDFDCSSAQKVFLIASIVIKLQCLSNLCVDSRLINLVKRTFFCVKQDSVWDGRKKKRNKKGREKAVPKSM